MIPLLVNSYLPTPRPFTPRPFTPRTFTLLTCTLATYTHRSLEKEKSAKLEQEVEQLRAWKTEFEVDFKNARKTEIDAMRECSEVKGMFQREKQRADDAVSTLGLESKGMFI